MNKGIEDYEKRQKEEAAEQEKRYREQRIDDESRYFVDKFAVQYGVEGLEQLHAYVEKCLNKRK